MDNTRQILTVARYFVGKGTRDGPVDFEHDNIHDHSILRIHAPEKNGNGEASHPGPTFLISGNFGNAPLTSA